MPEIEGINNQTIIAIQDNEKDFFDEFTKIRHIKWPKEQRDNNLLILSASMVGYIVTPFRTIKLPIKYPELTFSHVLRMYMYTHTFRKTDSARELDITEKEEDLDIINSFLKSLKMELMNGIIRSYKLYPKMDSKVKGKVNWNKSLIRILKKDINPVVTEQFKLSTDNGINRLIVGALRKISVDFRYKAKVLSLLDIFKDVKKPVERNGASELRKIVFNSNTNRYRKVLNYASLIIDSSDYSDLGNQIGLQSFILNFDALYEEFVIKVLEQESNVEGFTTWGLMHDFSISDQINTVTYKPDILFRYKKEDPNNESAYGILDCKNKAYSIFKNADVYQVLAYARKLCSKKIVLLYPSFNIRKYERLNLDYEIFDPSTIYAIFINIASENGTTFLENLRAFAKEVVDILNI